MAKRKIQERPDNLLQEYKVDTYAEGAFMPSEVGPVVNISLRLVTIDGVVYQTSVTADIETATSLAKTLLASIASSGYDIGLIV